MNNLPVILERDDSLPHGTELLGVAYRIGAICRPYNNAMRGRDDTSRQKCLAAYQAKPVEYAIGKLGDVCSRYSARLRPYGHHCAVGEVVDVLIKIDNVAGREGVEPDKHCIGAASCDEGYRAPGEMPPRMVQGTLVREGEVGYYGGPYG